MMESSEDISLSNRAISSVLAFGEILDLCWSGKERLLSFIRDRIVGKSLASSTFWSERLGCCSGGGKFIVFKGVKRVSGAAEDDGNLKGNEVDVELDLEDNTGEGPN